MAAPPGDTVGETLRGTSKEEDPSDSLVAYLLPSVT